jgi:hypothetical protein
VTIDIRKMHMGVEEIWHERGPRSERPLRVVTAAAVVKNPYAGRFVDDPKPWMTELHALGAQLATRLLEALGGAGRVEAYGKGAIVGEDGELEHGALWHEAGGWPLRKALNNPLAIVPAAKTVGTLGTRLMIPLGHIRAAFVRPHMNSAELTIWDAPRRDEIVFALAAADGTRIHARIGGLQAADIKVNDGQR